MYDTQFTSPTMKASQDFCAGRLSANGKVVKAGDRVRVEWPWNVEATVLRVMMTGLGYDAAVLDRKGPTGEANWSIDVKRVEVL